MSALPAEKRCRLPAAERRAALIDAALQVFGERSYGGATTAEIARTAGVSEPILYRHFASKRDLYIACLEAMSSRLREAAESIIAAEPDPREWAFAIWVYVFASRLSRSGGPFPNHLSVRDEAIALVAPDDFIAGKAGAPDEKAHQIPQRIQPGQPQRAPIAKHPPADRDGLDDAIEKCPSEQGYTQGQTISGGAREQPEQTERYRVSEPGAQVPGVAGEARASHPSDLMRKR